MHGAKEAIETLRDAYLGISSTILTDVCFSESDPAISARCDVRPNLSQVEPMASQVFTEPWRAQQAIDQPFVPVGITIGHRRCHPVRLRRQPGQGQRDPPGQSRPATRLRRHKTMTTQPDLNKVIDGVASSPSDSGDCRRYRRPEDRSQ